MSVRRCLCAVAVAFFSMMGAGIGLAAEGTPVSTDHIKALVAGKIVKAKLQGRQGVVSFTAQLSDDGIIKTKVDFGGPSDTGKWTIEDGIYCAKYKRFRFGRKNCWQILQTGDGEYLMKGVDGAKDQTVKVADAKTLIVRSK